MHLLKNLTSLAFEYGNRTSAVIFLMFGIIFASIAVGATWQLTIFYFHHSGIDVNTGTLLFGVILFGFGSFCAAFTFRGIVLRFKLWHLFRTTTYNAEYVAPANLSPVEAAFLVNKSWNENQTNAILAELIILGLLRSE